MAETEMMGRIAIIMAASAMLLACSPSPEAFRYEWRTHEVKGGRTGVRFALADSVEACLGSSDGAVYHAPNGLVFEGGATPKVAKILADAQPAMSGLKQQIAFSEREMGKEHPESPLSNWAADILLRSAGKVTGSKADMSVMNFGGIRVDMPAGPVLLDDIVSMFPFKNYVALIKVRGDVLKEFADSLARNKMQALGGVKLVIGDHKVESFLIGGAPVRDDKVYTVATIDFLMRGGDHINLADKAVDTIATDVLIRDVILDEIAGMTARGEKISSNKDGRVIIKK